jgi:hypothetical protein
MNPSVAGDVSELRNFAAGALHRFRAGRRRRRLRMRFLCQRHLSGQRKQSESAQALASRMQVQGFTGARIFLSAKFSKDT